MKRAWLLLVLIGLPAWRSPAARIELGVLGGLRTVGEAALRDVYGNGAVYFPYLAVDALRGLAFGLGYEGGYERGGRIGLYQEESTLRLSGAEVFVSYRKALGPLAPYLKAGLGSYAFRQVVSGVTTVDGRKSGPHLALGLRCRLAKGWFLAAEAKYVPLKVRPLEEEVDLSGARLGAGVGYAFDL